MFIVCIVKIYRVNVLADDIERLNYAFLINNDVKQIILYGMRYIV